MASKKPREIMKSRMHAGKLQAFVFRVCRQRCPGIGDRYVLIARYAGDFLDQVNRLVDVIAVAGGGCQQRVGIG